MTATSNWITCWRSKGARGSPPTGISTIFPDPPHSINMIWRAIWSPGTKPRSKTFNWNATTSATSTNMTERSSPVANISLTVSARTSRPPSTMRRPLNISVQSLGFRNPARSNAAASPLTVTARRSGWPTGYKARNFTATTSRPGSTSGI